MSQASALDDLDQYWQPGNPAASEQALTNLLPAAREQASQSPGPLVELLALVSRAEAEQGKLKEALESLEQAEKLLKETETAPARARVRWLLERGRLHILQHTPSLARDAFSRAWVLAVNADEDYFIVDIARMMAVIEPMKAQEEWLRKAINIAEQSKGTKAKRWLGELYTSLGWKLFEARQLAGAAEAFRNSASYFRLHGTERQIFLARWSEGRTLRKMNRFQDALQVQLTIHGESGTYSRDGRLLEEIGECLQALKRKEDARPFFALAHKELSSPGWVSDNQPLRLKRLKDLGGVE